MITDDLDASIRELPGTTCSLRLPDDDREPLDQRIMRSAVPWTPTRASSPTSI
ncbi:hypothetical protein [Arthrobacter wenxiniae]|uniref:hypothetical protein n=1 Tax=Arthrobacter wenxiniae TaxID=2713570 RepID=UPI001C3FF8FE|nr:hypothetical protein [Arthrobacter wenxiniae]